MPKDCHRTNMCVHRSKQNGRVKKNCIHINYKIADKSLFLES